MSHEFMDDRRRALEEAFFAQQTDAWRRQQREAAEAMTKREALAASSGITDSAVLDRLLALGLDGSSLAALAGTMRWANIIREREVPGRCCARCPPWPKPDRARGCRRAASEEGQECPEA